ncbi:MAG: CDP-diacylglycerol--glycerol-3-phosphate 3-phosphatidyltransferase [Christensenellales bacterium]|jgi:CDP-diacylglycerol--glycerol-3-phosphate 3-phosphatidyltransferase
MNLPTKITLARIALIPVMVFFYYFTFANGINLIISGLIYALAGFTDYLDGHLARSRNEVTDLGKFLDPIADKVLVVAALFLIVEAKVLKPYGLGAVLSGIIVARELMIGALRQIAASKGIVLAADRLGKTKTLFTNCSLPFLMAAGAFAALNATLYDIIYYIGYLLFIVAVIMTIVSGANYIIKNRKLFAR